MACGLQPSPVTLGVFSNGPRTMAGITNRVSEVAASRCAVLTADSPAIETRFDHGESVYTVRPADPVALADAVRTLADDPGLVNRIADGGHEVYDREFDLDRIGETLRTELLAPA